MDSPDKIPEISTEHEDNGTRTSGQLQMSILAYIPFMCFIPLFNKDADPYTRSHGRQGLILFVIEIVSVIMLLPIGELIWKLLIIACIVASIAGLVAAYSGKRFELPFVGKWADKI
ncbi:MAG: hypothetical protein JNL74_20840 [Fibrobacteres bacterium]|nr:hypothetical protein [Fibrobacterota bacterium]